MSFRPSIELLMVVLLLVFLAAGYKVLTEPGKYFPEAAPHAGQAFTELALVAGPTGVKGHRDAKGEDAQFSAPRAMAMDRAGNLYVLDTGNHALRKIQLDSTVSTVADLSGDVSPQFGDYPDGIAVDASGNVYIAEASNELILKVTPAGTKSVFAGQRGVAGLENGSGTAARFAGPSGLVFDNSGNLLVADSGNNAIRKISPAGAVSTLAGGGAGNTDGPLSQARFAGPWGLALDPSGTLYVAELGSVEKDGRAQAACAIRRIGTDGVVSTPAENALYTLPAGQRKNIILLNAATAIALDSQGTLFYLWQGDIQRVHIAGSGGDNLLTPRNSTLHPAPEALAGITIDRQGALFVSDATNDYIVKVTPQQDFNVFAGSSDYIGESGKQRPIPGLDQPLLARTDAAGNIFVLYDNARHIRKLTPDYQIGDTLNRLVDDTATSAPQPQAGARQMSPGVRHLFRGADLENTLGFHFFSFDQPTDNSFTIAPISNTFAVDAEQNLYLPSLCGPKKEGCVVRVTAAGKAKVFASGYTNVQDIQTDNNGNVYVYDALSSKKHSGKHWLDHIVVLKPNGTFMHAFSMEMPGPAASGKNRKNAGPANQETAFLVTDTGDIYVADQSSVRKLTSDGKVSTVAGSDTASGYVDAPGAAARFKGINGIAFGKQGIIYVSEGGNNALRQITADGKVSTVVNQKGEGIIHLDPEKVGALDQLRGLAALPDGNLVLLNRYAILRTQ